MEPVTGNKSESIIHSGLHFSKDHVFPKPRTTCCGHPVAPVPKRDTLYRKIGEDQIREAKAKVGGGERSAVPATKGRFTNWLALILSSTGGSKPKPPALLKPGGTHVVGSSKPPAPPKPPGKPNKPNKLKPKAAAPNKPKPPAQVLTVQIPVSAPVPKQATTPVPANPAAAVIPTLPATSGGVKTKRALLIGSNYTGSDNALNGCIRDVDDIKKVLLTKGYAEANIRTLADRAGAKKEDLPTRVNIIAEMKKLIAATGEDDEAFIHYSGHGTQVYSVGGNESLNADTPNQDDAICPLDFDNYPGEEGFITDNELKDILVKPLAKGARLRAFFDCCHSGSALDLPLLYVKDDIYAKEMKDQSPSNAVLISGCKDSQTSADAYIGGNYNGALTWAIIKSLESSNQTTTWEDLLAAIRANLKQGRYSQIPMLSVGAAELGNQVVDL